MNRFDRITALLLLLQTRSVVTARFLAEHFGVTERTIYRDIRTLETAGVPIGAEAGVGYFLERGYHLPPVSFTRDEAASILLGEKLLTHRLDAETWRDYQRVLNKIRAVLDSADKDHLSALERDVDVAFDAGAGGLEPPAQTRNQVPEWPRDQRLRECRAALTRRQRVQISYHGPSSDQSTSRTIEPIGLLYYSQHWHLIAWCCLRNDYRDFRLDRVSQFTALPAQFARHAHATLQQYLCDRQSASRLLSVELLFTDQAARFVGEQRYTFGLVQEEPVEDGVYMRFLTAVPDYMARWLLQFGYGVQVISGEGLVDALAHLGEELHDHWGQQRALHASSPPC